MQGDNIEFEWLANYMQLLSVIEAALTYNYSVEEESQDPKTIENQENKALEMASKDHWQLALALSFRPTHKNSNKNSYIF